MTGRIFAGDACVQRRSHNRFAERVATTRDQRLSFFVQPPRMPFILGSREAPLFTEAGTGGH